MRAKLKQQQQQQTNLVKSSPKITENERVTKEQQNITDLDDYVLIFNKPSKDNLVSNIIQIPQSLSDLNSNQTNNQIFEANSHDPTPVPSQLENYKIMEKNFTKTQTPPRSFGSQLDVFIQNNQYNRLGSNDSETGISPPSKFIVGSSPTTRMYYNSDENNSERKNSIKNSRTDYPVLSSPRLSTNSLNNPNLRIDELKLNYDQYNNNNNSKSNIRMVKNYQENSTTCFNELYSGKNSFPIFIDDLEEETILDVNYLFKLKGLKSLVF